MKTTNDEAVKRYVAHFENFERRLNGGSGSPLHQLRKGAMAEFQKTGFPTTKHEEWRFTNVAPLRDAECIPFTGKAPFIPGPEDITPHIIGGNEVIRFVFVNGRYQPDLSSSSHNHKGLVVRSLKELSAISDSESMASLGRLADIKGNPFTALNTAFVEDGTFIHVTDGVEVQQPIHLLYLTVSGGDVFVTHPRNLFIVGKNSKVSIVESFAGLQGASYFTNVVTEMYVGEGAVVEHDKLQTENHAAFHIGASYMHLEGRSTVTSNAISLGGSLVRNDVYAHLAGEYAECTLNGLSLATGTQLIDNHTAIDHAMPNCASHELYKSILDGSSRGVFNGKIFVRKDAQKTDAKQTNKTLLLSDEATIDTKPQLEIFADDVKCTHGATVGQLDEDQVFYLRARGIGLDDARDILTFAFAQDVVSRIHVEELRARLEGMIHNRLYHGRLLED